MAGLAYIQVWIANLVEHLTYSRESAAATGIRVRLWMAAARGKGGEPIGTLPDDDLMLADLAFVTPSEWSREKEAVTRSWTKLDGRWNIRRVIEQHAKMRTKSESAAAAADKRWGKKRRQRKRADPPKKAAQVPNGFETFWKAYPRKTAKDTARKAWAHHKPPLDTCLKTLAWQRDTDQWQRGIIPHGATWINQHRWEDEQERTSVQASAPTRPPVLDVEIKPASFEVAKQNLQAVKRMIGTVSKTKGMPEIEEEGER